MTKALITGINGQDGAWLSRHLLGQGYAVTGAVRPGPGVSLANLDEIGVRDRLDIRPVDLFDPGRVKALLEDVAPDEIYHLAGISSVAYSFRHPVQTLRVNVMSAAHLLEAARAARPGVRFYNASSSEMFGHAERLPADEQTPLRPVSPYGVSKAAAHQLVRQHRESYGMFACSGILFNHESVLRPAHFVTKKIVSAAVRISRGSGERLTLGNLDVRRDWGYAPDYVEAMALMLRRGEPADYVVATGESRSLREFGRAVFGCLDIDFDAVVESDPSFCRPGEIKALYGDASRVRDELGWRPARPFAELVRVLVEDEIRCQQHLRTPSTPGPAA